MGRLLCGILSVGLPAVALAQGEPAPTAASPHAVGPGAGYFFMALLIGVILAVAFQFILTNLSVAAGLNLMGGVTSPKRPTGKHTKNDNASDTPAETVMKISNGFGVWTLVTATIALFFASYLSVRLSLTGDPTVGLVLGLAIWGLFYVVTMMIEVNAVSSLVGSLFKLAANGLRTAYSAVSSFFSKSEESKAVDTAAKITAAVKEELLGGVDVDDVKKAINGYVNQLAPKPFNPADLRHELAKLFNETEIAAIARHEGPMLDLETIQASLSARGMESEEARSVATKVQSALSTIQQEAQSNKDNVSKVTDASMRLVGVSPEQAEEYRQKIENYLRSTGKESLNPEGIKHDLELLFKDRKEGMEALRSRFSAIDKSTIVAVLAQRKDMTEDEARHIVDQVESILGKASTSATSVKESVTTKVRDYLNSLDRPELNYEGLQHDLELLLHDPKGGLEALGRRFKAMDRDTLKAILSSREGVSEEDAERTIQKLEDMRNSFIQRIDQMRTEVDRRLEAAKEETLHQADNVRKVAATAAWWAFGTAVVSGIASAIAGIVAANML